MLETPFPLAVERFPRIRQSRLATFDRCALSAHFAEEYERDWTNAAQARGTMLHRVVARCLARMYRESARQIPVDEALDILRDELRQRDVDSRCGRCGAPARWVPERDRVVCDEGHAHASSFINLPAEQVAEVRWIVVKWAVETEIDVEALVDVEQRLMATVRYPRDAGGDPDDPASWVERDVTGQLDALFIHGAAADHAVVLDWKTNWRLPAPTEVGFDGYFQQRMYALLVLENFPTVQRVTLREVYVKKGDHREADVWRSDLDDLRAEIGALVERFDQAFHERKFPPSPGRHCHFCPRPMKCPIFTEVRAEGSITDAETALRYAREATVVKAALDSRLSAMAAYVDAREEPIPISDHKGPRFWGYGTQKRTSRPDKPTLDAHLKTYGAGDVPTDPLYKTNRVTRFQETPNPERPQREDVDAALEASLAAAVAQHRG